MIAPLNLIKIAGLIPCDPSLEVNNFYRLLRVDKVGLQLQFLNVNYLFWNPETLPELGDMENIMNPRIIGQEAPGDMLPAHIAQ